MLHQLALLTEKKQRKSAQRLAQRCNKHRRSADSLSSRRSEQCLADNRRFQLAQQLLQQGAWPETLQAVSALQVDYPEEPALIRLHDEATRKLALDAHWQNKIKERRRYGALLRRFALVVMLLLCSGLVLEGGRFLQSAQSRREQVTTQQTLLLQAQTAMQQHEYRTAIDLYRQLLTLNPNHAAARQELGWAITQGTLENEYNAAVVAMGNGLISQAEAILSELNRKAPNYRDTQTLLAQLVATQVAAPLATATVQAPVIQPMATAAPNALLAFSGRIAFQRKQNGESLIYVMQADGSQQQPVPDATLADLEALHQQQQWSAERTKRVYVAKASGRVDTNLFLWQRSPVTADAQDLMLTDFPGMESDPVWSPDGATIAFVANHSGNEEIWMLTLPALTAQQQTTNAWAWDKHPTWSPDGSQLAFYSNRSGQRQIWIMDADGANQQNLSNNMYEDWDPVWIP